MKNKQCACGAILTGKKTRHCSVKCSNLYTRSSERGHLAKDALIADYWQRWKPQAKVMHAALTSSTAIFNLKEINHE